MAAFGAVKKKTYELMETGEYVFTLSELEETTGDFGDRMLWKFLVALKEDPTGYICRDDGKERVLFAYTDPDVIIGSQCQEWAQVLTGRSFSEGDAPPDEDDLLGKRMTAYLTHYTPKKGKNAGVPREQIVAGSAKSYRLPGPKVTNGTGKAASLADPIPPDVDDDRDLIVLTLKKRVARLLKLDKENGQKAQEALEASELDTAPLADLERLSDAVAESITAALDA